jgi:hypothetical protein
MLPLGNALREPHEKLQQWAGIAGQIVSRMVKRR